MAYIYEIPLQPNSQTFQVLVNNVTYNMSVIWRGTGYVLGIADVNNNSIVKGLSLVTGADLLSQFGYLDLPFNMVILTDIDPELVPTYELLGITSHLCVIY